MQKMDVPMKRFVAATLISLFAALPGQAQEYLPVKEKDAFLSLIEGRSLRLPLYGLTLTLSPEGQITGKALGWGISGTWRWEDGYFCRNMDWSGMEIPYNCQLVEAKGDTNLRFTVDKGVGDSASFRLQ
jgi:hypothetical protein